MELNVILDALYARYRDKEPESMQYVFPPPAAPEDIAATEAALGMALPDELRALYARHAYMMDAWDGMSINPLQSLAKSRQSLENVAADMAADAAQDEEPSAEAMLTASGPVAPVVYAPSRIPFASQNCCDILIDQQPPAGGTPGQIIRLDIEAGEIEVVAHSLTEFFAQGLEAFSKEEPGKPGKLGLLGERLLGLAGIPVALVMAIGAVLLAVGVIAWGAVSVVAEGVAGLFRRKQN